MKKTNLLIIGSIITNSILIQSASAESIGSILKNYGIPCAVSMGLSASLVKNDGLQIGAAVCAGISTATFLNKKPVDEKELKIVVDNTVKQREMKIYAEIDSKFVKVNEEQENRTEETRKIMREILAERLIKMEEDLRSEFEKRMKSGDFLPSLEKKISAKIKEEVIIEGRTRNREIINQVVEEVIRQVVAKPVAVPEKME